MYHLPRHIKRRGPDVKGTNMRFSTVIKIILGLIFLILTVFFVFENIDPVTIWIPLFKGRHIGLIYIIFVFYVLGMSSSFWIITLLGIQRKRRMKLEEIPDSEQSLFEDEAAALK